MSKINNIDAEQGNTEIDYFAYLGIEYIGQQERSNDFSLDMFNDLATGITFLRRPMENVGDMIRRIRHTGGECICGHDQIYHADYGPPGSVGYTAGPCMAEDCRCPRFVSAISRDGS